ncbi:hypothetical protein [Pseudodesulfovibrio sp.]|uniref:hypothetical protein n=1 Tax=unclassified Pseudodesulfovibrio TaxID=2661612 RepID=UPI003B009EC2
MNIGKRTLIAATMLASLSCPGHALANDNATSMRGEAYTAALAFTESIDAEAETRTRIEEQNERFKAIQQFLHAQAAPSQDDAPEIQTATATE